MEVGLVLKKHKLKVTSARRNVLETIFSLNGKHFYADDICSALKHRKKNTSRASTFRAIQLFHEIGMLRMIEVSKSGCKFECVETARHHDHLCCIKCGRIIEFTQDTIEKLQDKVCREHAFTPTSHVLKIAGRCKKCNDRERRG